jgi:GT2 family glycosyltransferase
MKLRVVTATRVSRQEFPMTALGRSLALYPKDIVDIRLFESNALGLPSVYNLAIQESAQNPAILLFVHDDVFLLDFYWIDQIHHALTRFDIVGLAGNKRRVPRQPAWLFVDRNEHGFVVDRRENLSGIVGHGQECPPTTITYFGPPGQPVVLLDGMLLAVRSETLQATGLRFDERLKFHFYDLDFCRQAERLGLRMGTAAMTAVHQSDGNFVSEAWRASYTCYLEKWNE